ncbi:methyl-accepting chemotaxis protein [Caproiciproducens sp. CPB-2]|uniref:methyl-accepting chemotaxis protein n=1 Tax=Caproiciproducens sp. CPB-2 TaxID=3030017 RepID=UPI0023DBE51A|nr:methyl-accepting chemotaxis protein [Caproiciproducens sp. CPB-2]MDF1495403.1 methyl-accepting chemotaxis protein [Caproiciproducens sp. CPB-2]
MKNLKIANKLILSFLAISLITVIVGAAGIYSMRQMEASSTKLFEQQTAPLPVMSDILLNLDRLRGLSRDYILYYDDQEELKTIVTNTEKYKKQYDNAVEQYEPTISTAATKELFAQTKTMFDEEFWPTFEAIVQETGRKNIGEAMTNLKKLMEINIKVTDNYTQCMQNRVSNAKANHDANQQLGDTMMLMMIVIILFGVFVSGGWGFWLARKLSRPVNEMAVAAESIAQGKLDVDVTYSSRDEIGSLARSLQSAAGTLKLYVADISDKLGRMAKGDMTADITQEYAGDFAPIKQALMQISDELNNTLAAIDTSAEQVNSGAAQVSDGSQELAQGATEQASSVEELAASVTEVSGKVSETADNVRVMAGYVKDTVAQVEQGNEQMRQMLSSMEEISNTSSEIGKIIKVIDDIAFQTNILALNAAVEAARAGSAGKGFAVVADEVRNLASKSANAAKQTTSLIEGSIQSVKNGTAIAGRTAKELNEIAAKVGLVGETIVKIDMASSDQAAAIEQITTGVDQVSAVVQTNSATAEESAAASEELSAQADMLRKLVGAFQLKKRKFTVIEGGPETGAKAEKNLSDLTAEAAGQKY